MDIGLALAGLFVGFVVGLTGMGGGALMTPILVLFFHVQPLAAVSSDLVAAAVMKPVGGAVHLRNGTVNLGMAKLLIMGSVPSAFCGVLLLRALGNDAAVQDFIKVALGVALVVAAVSLIVKAYISLLERARRRAAGLSPEPEGSGTHDVVLRPLPTILVGVVGGLIVGLTSVGSGSLIIIALITLYPSLKASQLVGTDLIQAIPLVASAAAGHILFGDFKLDVTTSLLIGCLPGVYLGARVSSRAPGGLIRRCLAVVLLASGLKLVGIDTVTLGYILLAAVVLGPLAWAYTRHRHGLPASARSQLAQMRQESVAGANGAAVAGAASNE